jgi:hypothetical protein
MFARLAAAGLLLGIAFATQARAEVTEAELAQVSLNAISLCVHAALYQWGSDPKSHGRDGEADAGAGEALGAAP